VRLVPVFQQAVRSNPARNGAALRDVAGDKFEVEGRLHSQPPLGCGLNQNSRWNFYQADSPTIAGAADNHQGLLGGIERA